MFFFRYLKEIILGITGFIAVFLFNRNKTLKVEKEQLQQDITTKDRVINVQHEVMEASSNIEHTDLDDSLKRLSNKDK
jgi:hypothetical protein